MAGKNIRPSVGNGFPERSIDRGAIEAAAVFSANKRTGAVPGIYPAISLVGFQVLVFNR